MSGKPYQSSLIPYQDEIAALRSSKPPVSYARIAALLLEKHGLIIQRAAIAKFVKVRSGGRKVYFFRKGVATRKKRSAKTGDHSPIPVLHPQDIKLNPRPELKRLLFEHAYSQRYNLHRLPPEGAQARRKKLEEQGY